MKLKPMNAGSIKMGSCHAATNNHRRYRISCNFTYKMNLTYAEVNRSLTNNRKSFNLHV